MRRPFTLGKLCLPLLLAILVLLPTAGRAVGLQEIYSFQSAGADGRTPTDFTIGNDGAFYGTTLQGGSAGYGTVFRLATNGLLTTLASFQQTNGASPRGRLIQGGDGAFYGTTVLGGTGDLGTVFRVTTNGELTCLVSFGGYNNGANPYGGVVQGEDGALYGTTSSLGPGNRGTVFRVDTNGVLTNLVAFDGSNGSQPVAGLTFGPDGNLYGTTIYGGVGGGDVFRVTTNGTLTTLFTFGNAPFNPQTSLTLGSDGMLYGVTGLSFFRVATNGDFSTLALFNDKITDPNSRLMEGNDGMFYGTTSSGGQHGLVYRIPTNGAPVGLAALEFPSGAPGPGLIQTADGSISGICGLGGSGGGGIIYRLDLGVKMLPLARGTSSTKLQLSGFPYTSYYLQRATNLSGPWTNIYNFTTGADGMLQYFDSNQPKGAAFYRGEKF